MTNKIIHWLASIVLFGIPMILASHSTILDLTVGGLLNAIYLAVSQLVKPTAPTSSII